MSAWLPLLLLLLLPATGLAAEASGSGHEHGLPADYHKVNTTPEVVDGIRKYAVEAQSGAQKNFGMQPVHDNEVFAVFQGDRLEYQTREGNDALLWDFEGWVGEDYNKLYFRSEGAWLINKGHFEEAELEILYGRNISSFWDLQVGVRHDFKPDPNRTFAALGVEGLARYWFEVEATAYVSQDGDVSAKIEAEYDLLLSQRLILQPRFETAIAVQEVRRYGIGQGINYIELGARLRYEIRREFAPYVGISWTRKVGETENLAEAAGESIDVASFVAGVKFWF